MPKPFAFLLRLRRRDKSQSRTERQSSQIRVATPHWNLLMFDNPVKSISFAGHLRTGVNELPELAVCHNRGMRGNPIRAVHSRNENQRIRFSSSGRKLNIYRTVTYKRFRWIVSRPDMCKFGDRHNSPGWQRQE